MNKFCNNQIVHTIRAGDTLWRLAIAYNTSVEALLSLNPGIDVYNLKIGAPLNVCPGATAPITPVPPIGELPCADLAVSDLMRKLWSQHVYWTRMVLISIADRLRDQDATTARLLQNPKDLANLFGQYFGEAAAKSIQELLTEHLVIGAKLITALRDKQMATADKLTRQWYENADEMARAFATLSPAYKYDELRDMLFTHLRLTTDEVAKRLAGNYPADIMAFDKVEQEALAMADYFTVGLR